MMRERLRDARKPERKRSAQNLGQNTRAKTMSPNRLHSFGDMPDYWQRYKEMLEGYHRRDAQKHQQEKDYFEKVLDKRHKLCDDEEHF